MLMTLLEITAWLTLHVSVGGADVMIDNGEMQTMRGQQSVVGIEKGFHSVTVMKDGYRPYVDTITLPAGVNQRMYIWLEPIGEEEKARTSDFDRLVWDYQMENNVWKMRWIGLGAGICSGVEAHVSLFSMRYGLLSIDPCIWGFNYPFFSNTSHVTHKWQVHNHSWRLHDDFYEMSIPSAEVQLYYTPMVGVHFPLTTRSAFVLSAGPQISWTYIRWSDQLREIPLTYDYEFVEGDFPKSGWYFDPVWFCLQAGMIVTGNKSDLLGYLRYQDGFFIGMEIRF